MNHLQKLLKEYDRGVVSLLVDAFAESQPYVGVEVFSALDEESRRLDVKVDLFTYVMPSEGEHRLTVFLTQDSLVYAQAGGSPSYVHNHVLRGVVNGVNGQEIALKNNVYADYSFAVEPQEKWNVGNMAAVVFIENADGVQQAAQAKVLID